MADVTLTVYETARAAAAGVNFTDDKVAAIAANTYYFANDGRTYLALPAAAETATVVTPNTVDGDLAIGDRSLVLSTSLLFFGPFPPRDYNDAAGRVKFTVSGNTDVQAVRVP